MNKLGKIMCLLTSVALWQGCSSSSDSSDASSADSATDSPTVFLSRGDNFYKVTTVTVSSDGCETGAATELMNFVFPVSFVESTQTLSVGRLVGSPLQPVLGSGVVGTTGTLSRDNMVTDGTGCAWHQTDMSAFVLTGGDVFTLDVTEHQDMFSGCGTGTPTGGMCTSAFKLTLEKTTAPADAGTGG